MTLRENFTDSMNAIFETRHCTLSEFAEELSISRSCLQEILKGRSNPTLETVELIASQLGMEPFCLFAYSGQQLSGICLISQFVNHSFELSEEDALEVNAAIETLSRILMKK